MLVCLPNSRAGSQGSSPYTCSCLGLASFHARRNRSPAELIPTKEHAERGGERPGQLCSKPVPVRRGLWGPQAAGCKELVEPSTAGSRRWPSAKSLCTNAHLQRKGESCDIEPGGVLLRPAQGAQCTALHVAVIWPLKHARSSFDPDLSILSRALQLF